MDNWENEDEIVIPKNKENRIIVMGNTKYIEVMERFIPIDDHDNFKASCDACKKDITDVLYLECETCTENGSTFRLCNECFTYGKIKHEHDDFCDDIFKGVGGCTYMMSSLNGRY